MQIKLLVEGGSMKPGPVLSQKLGPAGINIGKVISEVNDATKEFNGLKVPVELEVDIKTKDFDVKVFSPPVSGLLKKELGIKKGSGIQGKESAANASIEQIISIAKQKRKNLLARTLKSAVKSVLGTCTSLGILVESKSAVETGKDVDEGKYDKEIKEEKTETSDEKKQKLKQEFEEIHTQQEKIIKAEKEAEEAEAAEAAETVPEGTEDEEKPETGEAKPTAASPEKPSGDKKK